jgi:ornithine cyclodeaminase/alanine dehydrogenase-like protein (mu-crystallin family)
MTLLLTAGDLAAVLGVEDVIEAVAGAFAAFSGGRTQTPPRVGVEPPGADGVLLAMPCAVAPEAGPGALGAKIVSVFRGNPARGLPTVTSIYILSDYETGAPLAILDGGYLTALRTAAGSAVATRHLARPEAHTLGVFGTGVQARFHVETIRRVRPLDRVLVAATSADKAARFAAWVGQTTRLAATPASAEEVSEADIVSACTTSPTPVVVGPRVVPGAHVNAVGAFTPSTRELPTDLVQRARVYVDTRPGACSEAGDLLIPVQEGAFALSSLAGEIGEVVLGTVAGRSGPDEVTVYKSVGAAFLDAATARLAYAQARASGRGTEFTFG